MLTRRTLLSLSASTTVAAVMMSRSGAAWAATPAGTSPTFGSGHFGTWIEDAHGGVAYCYTCDQLRDPKAVTRTDPVFRGPTDHWHQVGNDRLVATASNFGHMQVRQDEGGPKFLQDYIPSEGEFGGGIGWLSDGKTIVSTYYSGAAERFERDFGMGYYRKSVAQGGYAIEQTIVAPFGDDPVLVSAVTIRNDRPTPATLRWTEYWGCRTYEFAGGGGGGTMTEIHFARRIFARRFRHDFTQIPGGLIERKTLSDADREPPAGDGGARSRDLTPPATFLVALDDNAVTVATDAKAFFAEGGVAAPLPAKAALDGVLADAARPALFVQREIMLQPGESRTLHSLYGYLTEGRDAAPLIAKYRATAPTSHADTVKRWASDGLRLDVPDAPWVARENAWGNYYLRSGATYDSFFEEHIVSQGHAYQYIGGGQGAARDPLQHVSPLVFSNPALVKEVLRYTLKMTLPNGAVYGGVNGFGIVTGSAAGDEQSSDYGLWLLLLASDYILATRDRAFLDEPITLYPVHGPKARQDTVGKTLDRCARYLRDTVGGGRHGLLRVIGGDWNDNLLLSHCSDRAECKTVGESVMSAAMAAYIMQRYAETQAFIGGPSNEVARYTAFAGAQRTAVAKQWTGRWYKRAWLGDKSGWLGDDGNLWLEPQPWAIISGAATPDRARTLVANIDRELRKPSPIGAILCNRGSTETDGKDLGVAEEGGIWPAINTTLVWALSKVDPAMAWDEWKKNSLAAHAEAYPDIWYGIWSGPDTFNSSYDPLNPGGTMLSDLIRHPGQIMDHVYSTDFGMTDFPVMNMHPHSTPLWSMTKLIGAEFTRDGLTLAPTLPMADYAFRSPLLGLRKSATGYNGWYAPSGASGDWTIHFTPSEAQRFRELRVNDAVQPLSSGGPVIMRGPGGPDRPLRWSLRV